MVDLGLNRSTVTRVVNELRERGVMRMVGKDGAAFLYVYEGDA
jgi:DNA-binding IclR family transcriptional regulator